MTVEKLEAIYQKLFKSNLDKPGNILYATKSKEDFENLGANGIFISNSSYFFKVLPQLTHITPNFYRKPENLTFTTKLFGFSEENLKIINSFVIDIDTKKYSVQEILLACLDNSIGSPSLIIETPRGYQVHFLTADPFYISKKENHSSLYSAKCIAKNLKNSLKTVEADVFCNDFGFFRAPKLDNVCWLDLTSLYSVNQLINWSTKLDSDKYFESYTSDPQSANYSYMSSQVITEILKLKQIKSESGEIGRNNTFFTVALASFADGISKEETERTLLKFNQQLVNPLKTNEIKASIRSAYSGRYSQPNFYYLKQILKNNNIDTPIDIKIGTWYKHKKARSERKYSHKHEWEADIVTFINSKELRQTPYIEMSQTTLCKEVGCPQSTLNNLLKTSKEILKIVEGKGRNAITLWTTHTRIINFLLASVEQIKNQKINYSSYLKQIALKFRIPNIKQYLYELRTFPELLNTS